MMPSLSPVTIRALDHYETSILCLLTDLGAQSVLAAQNRILIKPNLVNTSPPPVTFPLAACEALIKICRQWTGAELIIAEGTGDPKISTHSAFRYHGYDRLAKDYDLTLLDLNGASLTELSNPKCTLFPTFMMPEIVMSSFVISAATLKVHSLARVTLSMKNMIGVAPPSHYQQGGYWRKSAFHHKMQTSIYEMNLYRKPDLALIDASVGLREHHLGGATCNPPIGKIVAGFDPVAVDAVGSKLLGVPWHEVGHIKMANGVLGNADAFVI